MRGVGSGKCLAWNPGLHGLQNVYLQANTHWPAGMTGGEADRAVVLEFAIRNLQLF